MAVARWNIQGFDSEFKYLIAAQGSSDYAGQAVTITTLKAAAAAKFNLIFTGVDSTTIEGMEDQEPFYQIEPKMAFDGEVVWIKFGKVVQIDLGE